MRKAVISAAVGAAVLFGAYKLLFNYAASDPGVPIGIAMGPADKGVIPMHVVVSMGMPRKEGPKLTNGVLNWYLWIDEHLDLRDSAGRKLEMQKMGFSNLITDQQAMTPEFYVSAKLTPGMAYTFDYIPYLDEKKRYRYTFTAAAEGKGFERVSLMGVE